MTMTQRCIEELERAGLFKQESDYGGMVGNAVKELLEVFQKQGHSGFSANITAELFHKLVKGDVLSPLTDSPDEWMRVDDDCFQNKRCFHVFRKIQEDKPYTIEGKAFSNDGGKTFYTNYESRVYFSLPGYPPKTEYII